jgi:hypothetical protein
MKQYFIPMILLALSGCQKPQSTAHQQQDDQSVSRPDTTSDNKPDSPEISPPTHADDIADWTKQLDEQSKDWDANNQVLETILAAKYPKQLTRKANEFYLLDEDGTPEQIKTLRWILNEMNKIIIDSETYIASFHRNIDTDLAAFTAAHSKFMQIDATNVEAQKQQVKILLGTREKLLHSMQNSLASAKGTEITPTVLAMSNPHFLLTEYWDLSFSIYSEHDDDSSSDSYDDSSSDSYDDSSSDSTSACQAMSIDNNEQTVIKDLITEYTDKVKECYLFDESKLYSIDFKIIVSAHEAIKETDTILRNTIKDLKQFNTAD